MPFVFVLVLVLVLVVAAAAAFVAVDRRSWRLVRFDRGRRDGVKDVITGRVSGEVIGDRNDTIVGSPTPIPTSPSLVPS